MTNVEKIIEIKSLNKTYKTGPNYKTIFNNLTFDIKEGDKVGILGKNGVGKTTLLNTIIGKTKANSGEIIFSPKIQNPFLDIQYLQQEFSFSKNFLVKSIVNLIVRDIKRNDIYDLDYYNHVSNVLNLAPLLKKRYKSLSGGEKQKVNLFSVLLYKPKLLILDEFTSNIDLETSYNIRRMLNEFNSTIILVSHNAKEISSICNRIIFLKDGNIQRTLEDKEVSEENIIDTFANQ